MGMIALYWNSKKKITINNNTIIENRYGCIINSVGDILTNAIFGL